MVVLAASICTKGGKAVISRQFRDMTRARIESLLASFPKLIPTGTQHTSVETSDVRYVYQPLEDLYILLITNKASNILQDIETLHLFARVVSDLCRSAEEREILKNAFQLLGAFDEVVSMGYREQVNLTQVRSVLEMESHEEKIQEIISRNKEAEAKEELKRRAKQLEMQRREQQKRAGSNPNSYLSGGATGYSSIPRFEAPEPSAPSRTMSSSPQPPSRAPAFKSGGMKLGSKRTKQAELLDALGGEIAGSEELRSAPPTPAVASSPVTQKSAATTGGVGARGSLPEVAQKSVHIAIKEQISLSLIRDGGLNSMELKGDMNLLISSPENERLRLTIAPPTSDFTSSLSFTSHPNIQKFAIGGSNRTVSLKDPKRKFPVNLSLAVLKWRYSGKDESYVPLSINCWPTPSNDGTCDVNLEYELENDALTLYDVVISIPLPAGTYPTVSAHTGSWSLNASHSLDWTIPVISSSPDDNSKSGSLEFNVGGDDVGAFFPVSVNFVGKGNLVGLAIEKAERVGEGGSVEEEVEYSVDEVLNVDEYLVE